MASPQTIQSTASADDGYIFGTAFNSNGTSMVVGNSSGTLYSLFARFVNVAIPKDATIDNAKIQFKSVSSCTATSCITRIYADASDTPTAPTTYATYVSKGLTTAYVDWTIGSWAANNWYDSPDIKAIIQELVNHVGWVSGAAMQVFLKNNGSSSGAYRLAVSYDATGNVSGPKLYIEYTEAVASATAKVNIGDTFKDVDWAGSKINVGDAWKAIAGVKINIGDVWKALIA